MTSAVLVLPDGRRLAWCERGDPAGSVVFAFHGLPGSRLQSHPDDSIAQRAGARVIHMDRPGFGLSDAQQGRRLRDWPADLLRLADHLGVDRFAIAGVSGGGPFACACLSQLGDRVRRAAIVSSVGPPGSMSQANSWLVRTGFALAPRSPWSIEWLIASAARVAARWPAFYVDRLIAHLPACDRAILSRPQIRAMLMRDMVEAFRNGHRAFFEDLRLESSAWGIAFGTIACPVILWHGARDTVVPPRATEALAALIPHASVKIFPEAGHFFVFDVWHSILEWLLS